MSLYFRYLIIFFISFYLAACGGSGNQAQSSVTPKSEPAKENITNPTPVIKPEQEAPKEEAILDSNNFVMEGDLVSEEGKSTALAAYHKTKIIKKYIWKQLAGSPVNLSSYRLGLVTFRPSKSGSYTFQVTMTTENGVTKKQTVQVQVNPSYNKQVELLRDRAIKGIRNFEMKYPKSLNGKDLFLTLENNIGTKLVANIDKKNNKVLIRTLRTTTSKLIKIQLNNKNKIIDEAYVLLEASKPNYSSYFCEGYGVNCAISETLGRTLVYNPASPYKDVLQACTFSNNLQRKSLCKVGKLPPLGYKTGNVTLEAIKNRLVVSEEWMGDAFIQFIKQMDNHNDFKTLLGSVTAIIISDNVQIPFFWALTGAIYLTPYDLYENNLQLSSISQPYDYKVHIPQKTSTAFLWHYSKDSKNISLENGVKRHLKNIHYNFAALLYHELSHANDFYPYSNLKAFDSKKILLDNIKSISDMTSNKLNITFPLKSQKLKSLANYRFKGFPLSSDLKNESSVVIANHFLNDGANDLYSYVNEKEDMAMLFEETMMKYRFNVDRHISIINQQTQKVIANRKGRIFDKPVAQRARMITSHLLPALQNNINIFFNRNE